MHLKIHHQFIIRGGEPEGSAILGGRRDALAEVLRIEAFLEDLSSKLIIGCLTFSFCVGFRARAPNSRLRSSFKAELEKIGRLSVSLSLCLRTY